jgi:hypothetical protein
MSTLLKYCIHCGSLLESTDLSREKLYFGVLGVGVAERLLAGGSRIALVSTSSAGGFKPTN